VLWRLAVIKDAKQAGFTIEEIRTLLHGFPAEATASERWRALAGGKLEEVDELIRQLREMRDLLERALRAIAQASAGALPCSRMCRARDQGVSNASEMEGA
jgi:DNA-binding transcriptional MerR regulator